VQTLNELYRSLAKKYHPDTVSSEEDKALFEELMVEINIARERGDLDTCRGMLRSTPSSDFTSNDFPWTFSMFWRSRTPIFFGQQGGAEK